LARDFDLPGLGIVALAALLRLGDLGRRSIWFDEAWAALGILDGRWEVAPGSRTPVFDALVRASATVFGRNEFAVRLPAALFGIAAVVLAWRLGRAMLGPGGGRLAAAIVGLLPIPVYYGKELKPYSAELFLVLALASLVYAIRRRPETPAGWAGLVAAVAVGMGITPLAPLLVAGAFVVLLPEARRAPRAYLVAGVGAGLAAVAWLRLVLLPYVGAAGTSLAEYWHLFFLPTGPPSAVASATLRSAVEAATWGLGTSLPHHADRLLRAASMPMAAALTLAGAMALGGVWLWRRGERWLPGLVLTWHLLFVGAALAGRYPYGPARISFFFLGPTALLLAAAASAVASAAPAGARPAAWLLVTLPIAWPLAGTWHENVASPFRREELRPVMERVLAERRPGDAIWVSPGARYAFRFYVPEPDVRTIFAGPLVDLATVRTSLAATAAVGGGRVWALFAHNFVTEEARIRDALGSLKLRSRLPGYGASALLLSAPEPAAPPGQPRRGMGAQAPGVYAPTR
jgi:4-amino-4-deoxy-L-arabinose transferase-like glycosyltransferase